MAYKFDKFYLFLCATIIFIDQVSKKWILAQPFIKMPIFSWFNIYITHNTGIAFGITNHHETVHPVLIILIIGLLYWLLRDIQKITNKTAQCATWLMFAGGLSNLIDRIYYGYVIDFIQLHYHDWYFPVFNGADISITLGAILLLGHLTQSKP